MGHSWAFMVKIGGAFIAQMGGAVSYCIFRGDRLAKTLVSRAVPFPVRDTVLWVFTLL